MTEATIDQKVAAIEETTLAVMRESAHSESVSDAAIAYAKRRIDAARKVKEAQLAPTS